ncbi:hypothetical protein [Catenuloplanes indicus]|uniref:Uncharacterized protein n=1 Tax=Catenuloplanes indicus TaxID=137267 RepID=A0AAE3VX08_9ACTN|nr:hypothetical protein [Catenuloplanes indicus]MDQ0365788.1 hypothetical protein [Catenuloplanes indicus]
MPPTPPSAAGDDGPPGWQAHGRPVPHPRQAADSAAFFSDTGEQPEVTQPSDAPLPPYMAQLIDHPGAGQQTGAANPWAPPAAGPPPAGRGDGFYDYDDEYGTERLGDPREQRAALAGWSGLDPADVHPNVSGATPVHRPDPEDDQPSLDFGTGQAEATQAIDPGDVPRGTGVPGGPPPVPEVAGDRAASPMAEFSPLSAWEQSVDETPPGGGRHVGGLQPITPGVRPAVRPFAPRPAGPVPAEGGPAVPAGETGGPQVPAQGGPRQGFAPGAVGAPAEPEAEQGGTFAPLAPAGDGAPQPPRTGQNPWSGRPFVPEVPPIPETARSPWVPFGGSAPVTEPAPEPTPGGPGSATGPADPAAAAEVISWPFAPRTAPDDDPGAVTAHRLDTVRPDVPGQIAGAGTAGRADTAGRDIADDDAKVAQDLSGGHVAGGARATGLPHAGAAAEGGATPDVTETEPSPARTRQRSWQPIPPQVTPVGTTASAEATGAVDSRGHAMPSAGPSTSEPPTAPLRTTAPPRSTGPLTGPLRPTAPPPADPERADPGEADASRAAEASADTAADERVDPPYSAVEAPTTDAGVHPAPVWVATTRLRPMSLPAGRDDDPVAAPDPRNAATGWNARTDEQPIVDGPSSGRIGTTAGPAPGAIDQGSSAPESDDDPITHEDSDRPRHAGDGPAATDEQDETPAGVIEAVMAALRERTGEQVPVSDAARGLTGTSLSAEVTADALRAAAGTPPAAEQLSTAPAGATALEDLPVARTGAHEDRPITAVSLEPDTATLPNDASTGDPKGAEPAADSGDARVGPAATGAIEAVSADVPGTGVPAAPSGGGRGEPAAPSDNDQENLVPSVPASPVGEDGMAREGGTTLADADAGELTGQAPEQGPGQPRDTSDAPVPDAPDPSAPDLGDGPQPDVRAADRTDPAPGQPTPGVPAVKSEPGLSFERSAEIGAAVAALRSGARKAGSIVYTPAVGGRRRAPVPQHMAEDQLTPATEAGTPAAHQPSDVEESAAPPADDPTVTHLHAATAAPVAAAADTAEPAVPADDDAESTGRAEIAAPAAQAATGTAEADADADADAGTGTAEPDPGPTTASAAPTVLEPGDAVDTGIATEAEAQPSADQAPDDPAEAGAARKSWARTPAEETEWITPSAAAAPPGTTGSGEPEDRADRTNAPERDDEDDDVTVLSTNLQPDPDHDHDDAPQLRPGDVVETPIAVWTDEAAAPFRQQWHEIKAQFVDDPVGALAQAQTVCANAVHDLADALLAEQAGLDPHKTNATPDTESMRIAMRRYREFLDRVLAL